MTCFFMNHVYPFQDISEWDEIQKERKFNKQNASPAQVSEKVKLTRTEEINERIGYNPRVVNLQTPTTTQLPFRP